MKKAERDRQASEAKEDLRGGDSATSSPDLDLEEKVGGADQADVEFAPDGPSVTLDDVFLTLPLYATRKDTQAMQSQNLLWQGFGSRRIEHKPIINGITLDVKQGEKIGIVGSNGAGKTTLLKLIAGILEPDTGTIVRQGRVLSILALQAGMKDEATGYENVFLYGLNLGLRPVDIRQKLDQIVEFSELGDALRNPVYSYSAGMKGRLAFSIAMASDPDILVLDEWLGAGDAEFQSKARTAMHEFVSESGIVFLASHNQKIINSVCNRLVTLDGGTIVGDSPIRNPFHERALKKKKAEKIELKIQKRRQEKIDKRIRAKIKAKQEGKRLGRLEERIKLKSKEGSKGEN